MSRLHAEGISFAHPGLPALLDGVSLTLERGECIVLIGENASGKSTLLRLLAGLIQPDSGFVSIDNRTEITLAHEVGLIFQNPDHQLLAATVEDELALGLEYRGLARAEISTRVEAALDRFNLQGIRNSSPMRLSGGQKQRVAIASMMTLEVNFLLLDEPDAHLDAPSRKDVVCAIEEAGDHVGILWAASNLMHLPPARRFLLLRNGRTEEHSRDSIRKAMMRVN